MGYDIHITRREEWLDDAGPEITLDEWLSLVRSDPEMRLDGYAEAQLSGGSVLRSENPTMAVWHAYSKHGHDGGMAWLWLSRGNVVAKNPDEEILRKMWLLARALSAKVQGDEYELYNAEGEVIPESLPHHAAPPPRKPWWRIW